MVLPKLTIWSIIHQQQLSFFLVQTKQFAVNRIMVDVLRSIFFGDVDGLTIIGRFDGKGFCGVVVEGRGVGGGISLDDGSGRNSRK